MKQMTDLWPLNADIEAFKKSCTRAELDRYRSVMGLFGPLNNLDANNASLKYIHDNLEFLSRGNTLELCFIFAYSRLDSIETKIDKKLVSKLLSHCSIDKFQELSPPPYDKEVYTLYRGNASCQEDENIYWHSWTDSYDKSLGFALKYNVDFKYKDAKVFRAEVRKEDILFYTDANLEREFFISTADEFGNKSISPEVYIEMGDDPLTDKFEEHQSFHFDFIPMPLQKSAELYIESNCNPPLK